MLQKNLGVCPYRFPSQKAPHVAQRMLAKTQGENAEIPNLSEGAWLTQLLGMSHHLKRCH